MNKTLIAYTSKGGATKEAAQIISGILKTKYELDVDVFDLRKDKKKLSNLAQYNSVVVGSGVRSGKVYNEALDFLKQDFGDKKVAFFVCSGDAGDPTKYEEAHTKYVTDVLANYAGLKTVATEAFGGRQKMLGRTVFNNFNPDKISKWAETLGTVLTE
ncbi:MAG: flavodoxin domain-containing protein [Candidatus Bathyarchaeota archaeon]|nr:flavodoxin domain-containing protein [Candidatus Bathyarchaeota archaeon]